MLKTLFSSSIMGLAFTLASAPVLAQNWQLDSENSSLHFVSVKNDHVAEVHRFTEINGDLTDGKLTINIPVSSLDTDIAIRNERMHKHLFDSAEYPLVTATAQIPDELYDTSTTLGTLPAVVPLTVFIAGEAVDVDAVVQINKLSSDRIVATTSQPVLISTREFGLVEGVNQLREIAGLDRIDYVVPVTFTVQFDLVPYRE
ncbi:YceI family protein [Pseudidiomarina terrestris]|uniref:YceI family protein n=1 Tax=Pseudidiomarina terrestris TaxID=2820060 RepID=UPI00264ADEA5|nr:MULTISPECIES: YceI family protein [unclassified Pseudidiomarina]MDN7127189.1 YceI family protein [Pseudidiomarina sp. 1APR75-33.1]MDN7135398.1 YceI family protein [Pseudidiomarina sp. 1ASP75-5]MEA3586864.1 YceI family protein [Pseudidiomarina sp. 1APP75-27a]